eukprot:UN15455
MDMFLCITVRCIAFMGSYRMLAICIVLAMVRSLVVSVQYSGRIQFTVDISQPA